MLQSENVDPVTTMASGGLASRSPNPNAGIAPGQVYGSNGRSSVSKLTLHALKNITEGSSGSGRVLSALSVEMEAAHPNRDANV